MKTHKMNMPIINSACPVIVRLISLRFPFLCDQRHTDDTADGAGGKTCAEKGVEEHADLKADDIAVVLHIAVPAKASYVKNNAFGAKSNVDYVVLNERRLFRLLKTMKNIDLPKLQSGSGMIGIKWASHRRRGWGASQ
jgi:hypothetical protein